MSTETRPYLLVSKVEGIADRLIPATTRGQALSIAALATWEATPADPATVRALDRLGVKLEGQIKPPVDAETSGDLLAGAEGGEG
jgi:hypothetical protein